MRAPAPAPCLACRASSPSREADLGGGEGRVIYSESGMDSESRAHILMGARAASNAGRVKRRRPASPSRDSEAHAAGRGGGEGRVVYGEGVMYGGSVRVIDSESMGGQWPRTAAAGRAQCRGARTERAL
jgi:hypothetical protein